MRIYLAGIPAGDGKIEDREADVIKMISNRLLSYHYVLNGGHPTNVYGFNGPKKTTEERAMGGDDIVSKIRERTGKSVITDADIQAYWAERAKLPTVKFRIQKQEDKSVQCEMVLFTRDYNKLTEIEGRIRKALVQIKTNILAIGRMLYQAKKIIGEGNGYHNWIKGTFGNELPISTAGAYYKIYATFCEEYNIEKEFNYFQDFPVWFLIMVTQDKFPREARRIIFGVTDEDFKNKALYAIKHTDLRLVEDKFRELKEGNIAEDEFLEFVQAQRQKGIEISKGNFDRAREDKKLTLICKLKQSMFSARKNVDTGLKRWKIIESVNPLYDDQRAEILEDIDYTMGRLSKFRKVVEENGPNN